MTAFPGDRVVLSSDVSDFLTGPIPMNSTMGTPPYYTMHWGAYDNWEFRGQAWFHFTALTTGKLFIDFATLSTPQHPGGVGTGFLVFTDADPTHPDYAWLVDHDYILEVGGVTLMGRDPLSPTSLAGNDDPDNMLNGVQVTAGKTYYIWVVSGRAINSDDDNVASGHFEGIGTSSEHFGPVVVKDPEDITVNEGATASFRSNAAGNPDPNLGRTWSKHPPAFGDIDEAGWVGIYDGVTPESGEYLTFTAALADDGWLYRASYSQTYDGEWHDAFSAPATLTIGEITLPGFTDDWDDVTIPDAEVGDGVPDSGSATVLELVRQFSYDTRQAVRIIDDHNIEIVNLNDPLPIGIAQADAASMYHSVTRTAQAGEKTLSLEENDLILTATAEITEDDVRIIKSAWQLPNKLPVMGLAPAVVSRVSYSFTPDGFTGSLEFVYLTPLAIVRRSA